MFRRELFELDVGELDEGVDQPRAELLLRINHRQRAVESRLERDGQQIAKALFVTEATVKTHLVHLFGKLGVESRAKAVTLARDTGLISPFDSRDN